ncbi:class I SAM-dependent methyltransferase [Micromonospora sp. DT229]|uniref:class I SAM-dependent methyltransferase n=1 Tax=Micromonospora sp. DT229 TaxID=3393430 RepID=UPI003CF69E8F
MTGSSNLVERVQLVGTGTDDEISALVKETGLDTVLDILADEIVFRCDEPVNRMPVHLALTVTHGADNRQLCFRIARDEPVTVVPADEAGPVRRELRITATDLVRRLFGPVDQRGYGDLRDTFLPRRPDDLRELPEILAATNQASGTLLSGCGVPRFDLGKASLAYGSDKWASFHWYTTHYEREFARYRDQPVRVLEIGIGGYQGQLGGGSLKMWKKYFHRGTIYGLDLFDKSALNQQRLTALTADQGNPAELAAIAERYGPFDIVIDDGSHENPHVLVSFEALFPYLRSGGLYVIEDMHTAYIPRFGGSAGPVAGPDTSIGLLKRLLDDMHYQEQWQQVDGRPTLTQEQVASVRVYRNIAFIEKGANDDICFPRWMDDQAWMALGAIPPASDAPERYDT